MRPVTALAIAVLLSACRASPLANPEFNDAAKYVFLSYDAPDVDLAYALREYERNVYLAMDVEANGVIDRAFTLERLQQSDIEGLGCEHGLDPALALPVAVGGVSLYTPDEHGMVQFLTDHTPVEPYSPDHYDRQFVEGEDCFTGQDCLLMKTYNELTKKNAILEIPYEFHKTFRWVDLNLPPPEDFTAEDELPTRSDEPRWAMVARSWTTEIYESDSGNSAIEQSYTIDSWIPRDGRGFVRDGTESNLDDGDWDADSNGSGSLRALALWSQTKLGVNAGEDLIIATTRGGIDDNFKAADEWLEEELGEREAE